MAIIVQLMREPVTVDLVGAYAGVGVTLRRLTTPQFQNCQNRALAILSDGAALTTVLVRHGLCETGADVKRALNDPAFAAGFGAWLGEVECGIEAISAWTGIKTETGEPAPLARDRSKIAGVVEPVDPADLLAREVIETMFLDQHFRSQVSRQIDMAARILAIEGKGSGLSETGTAGAAPTAEGLNGVSDAPPAAKDAPPAVRTAPAANARASRTDPPRPRA